MTPESSSNTAALRTNRLAREKSPYLLQHAHNPVDWFAWNDEAFQKARREHKPIFLSIGYSTCHWCHVMERESFENDAIASFLNRHFVSIKVDREERPDVDRIYMTFVQATTGQGGWPLNLFLTPDLKAFYGGTYYPPAGRSGRPGFLQLLQHIHKLWETRRNDLTGSADNVHARLKELSAIIPAPSRPELTPEVLRNAARVLKQTYDPRYGGFGGAPKFPQPGQPQFLLRCGKRFDDEEAIGMVLHTCKRMAAGGIHDQLGGGFARYSVDAGWLIPHFEKMLYDNAQLAGLYLDAHLLSPGCDPQTAGSSSATRRPPPGLDHPFADTARDILEYLLRDMTHPEGGFYSAEDADSEGHEGKFYCWTTDELERLLTPEEFNVVVRYYGITREGNFIDHSHPQPLPGQNVLSVVSPLPPSGPADAGGSTVPDASVLATAKEKMFAARSKRVRPQRDDKILTSWNGLALGAFARASAVLGEPRYRAAAEKNLAFIQNHLWERSIPAENHTTPPATAAEAQPPNQEIPSRQKGQPRPKTQRPAALYHRWRDGERDQVQLLDDYAFLLSGVLDLYEATIEPRHLDFALALAEPMLAGFHDAENGGFWQTPAGTGDLILRVKEDYDGAEPSGNSVAVLSLLRLAAITGRADLTETAEKSLRLYSARLQEIPQALTTLLAALDFAMQEPLRVVVAGDPASTETRKLLRAVHSVYQPNKVVLGNVGAVEPFARTLPAPDGPVVYLCTGNSCEAPTRDTSNIIAALRSAHNARPTG